MNLLHTIHADAHTWSEWIPIRRTPPSPHDLHYRWLDTQNRVSDLLGPSFVRDPSLEGKKKWNLNEVFIAWKLSFTNNYQITDILSLLPFFSYNSPFRIIPFHPSLHIFSRVSPSVRCYKRRVTFAYTAKWR